MNRRLQVLRRECHARTLRPAGIRPGSTFWVVLREASPRVGDDDCSLFVALFLLGQGFWLCCKLSVEVSYAGPFDLILDADEWAGGIPVLIEPWCPLDLHESDMIGGAFADIPEDWVERGKQMYLAHQRGESPPAGCLDHCGSPLIGEYDERRDFQLRELRFRELARARWHQIDGALPLVPELSEVALRAEVPASFASFRLQPLAKAAAPSGVDIAFHQQQVLLTEQQTGRFELALEQDYDQVFLRLYSETDLPNARLWRDDKELDAQRGATFLEWRLGPSILLPGMAEIRLSVDGKLFFFQLWFEAPDPSSSAD